MDTKMKQITNHVLMIRPVAFRMNEQTAVNNYYQKELDKDPDHIQKLATKEFDNFVDKLRQVGVKVTVVSDTLEPNTPDSIFPNNWVSFHQNGTVGIYPMFAENRRLERRDDILKSLESDGYKINKIIKYTSKEDENIFLEGTGSIILDRENRTAYCALSPRADRDLFFQFCKDFDFAPVVFTAYQTTNTGQRKKIYHTNVMMCVGKTFSVINLSSIDDVTERQTVINTLEKSGKEIIDISESQVCNFAGNMLEVQGRDTSYVAMSQSAYNALDDSQRKRIEGHAPILSVDITTIETLGGGSARCMMAEVFLQYAPKAA
ncbi:uncharacterized protein [Clytia hemisphaerica]|uniref:Amidinotransferase n=1 Tax=Clytia hemisphaerica TaxID=252671 RepID=A0A7M5WRB8_9CNID